MKVLITGASSGIGREFARILAPRCKELILVGRDEIRLESIREELSKWGGLKIKIVATDLSKQKNCIKLYKENPDVDFLINNAGFGDTGRIETTSLKKETDMINTNIVACHTLTKLYLTDMKAANKGRILNVASIAGFLPGPLMATYYATKAYVVRFSEAIREELRRDNSNVKISILCPGPVATNFEKNANVNFKFDGMDSHTVAKYAISHLNRFYIVPGVGIKIARIIAHFVPASIAAAVVYKLQSEKKK